MAGGRVEKAAEVSTGRLAVFALFAIPLAGAGLPLAVYLPAYYAQDLGLGLNLVGAIFMLTRGFDLISDPLIGYLSDRTRTRFGRRKPWIAAGAPFFLLATSAIFIPGWFGVRPNGVWLATWLSLFYVSFTMIVTPFYAWSGELSAQYHGRSRVQTFVHVTTAAGLLLVLVLPALIDQTVKSDAGRGTLKVAVMGGFILATLLPAAFAALILTPEPPLPRKPTQSRPAALRTLVEALKDPLLLRVLGSDFAVTLGQLIRSALFVFFVSAYMHRPNWTAGLFLLQFVFGVSAGPIWLQIGYRLGKHRAAVLGELVQVAINLSLILVTPSAFGLLVALTVAQGLAQGSGNLMLRAMVADVADHQRLKSGEERTGLLFSMFSLSTKLATAVAVGIALPLVARLGFHPGHVNSDPVLLSLKLVFAIGPALAHLASALLLVRFPLDQSRTTDIRRALDAASKPSPLPTSSPLATETL